MSAKIPELTKIPLVDSGIGINSPLKAAPYGFPR